MRKVIFHYHLFKNAGTSLDAAFKENFNKEKGEWESKEFSAASAKNRREVVQWVEDNPKVICFSSHTALLPIPQVDGVEVFPVIFIRHPLDRIASAYAFESKQGGGSFGAVLARNTSLAGYVETRLSIPNDKQCANFQAHRLAAMFDEREGAVGIRAALATEKLPFVGLVEEFSLSLRRLEEWLHGVGFQGICLKPVKRNVSQGHSFSLQKRLANIKSSIGNEVYERLVRENALDIDLHKKVSGLYVHDRPESG